MTTVALDVLEAPGTPGGPKRAVSQDLTIALVGNPNCGKTTLFNILTGLRAHTANISGTTIEQRVGKATVDGRTVQLIDLPGMYSLSDVSPEQKIARQALMGEIQGQPGPEACCCCWTRRTSSGTCCWRGRSSSLGCRRW